MQEEDNNNRVVYAPYNSMDALRDNHYLSGIWLHSIGPDHAKAVIADLQVRTGENHVELCQRSGV